MTQTHELAFALASRTAGSARHYADALAGLDLGVTELMNQLDNPAASLRTLTHLETITDGAYKAVTVLAETEARASAQVAVRERLTEVAGRLLDRHDADRTHGDMTERAAHLRPHIVEWRDIHDRGADPWHRYLVRSARAAYTCAWTGMAPAAHAEDGAMLALRLWVSARDGALHLAADASGPAAELRARVAEWRTELDAATLGGDGH